MNGSVFIINSNGLYTSNDADLLIERSVVKDDKGIPIASKHTQVIRASNFMKIFGSIEKDNDCYCQFKFDETDEVQTFSASVKSFTPEMIVLILKAVNLRNKEVTETIKNKIKEVINYGS